MRSGCQTRRMYNLLLLFGIFISGVKCNGYYFVTVPNVIRFDHEETVIVSVFGLKNAAVKVWLQFGEKQFSTQNVVVQDEATPFKTTVKVTENDLFDTVVEEKLREINVCSQHGGHQQCRDVILSYQTGYLIVQTDKPIYTPQQKVKVRTLALDESLRAVDGWQVGMDIISPSNLTMARKTKSDSASGFFDNEFTLPPFPETGMWTARAFYKGQFETESRALFEVQEYVLPTFGVTVQVDVPFILLDTADILVTVKAKYVYGKQVDGNARLTLNLKDESGVSDYILDIGRAQLEGGDLDAEGSVKEFFISVQDILESPLLKDRDFPAGCRLEIVATVLESATGKEEATSYDGTIFADEPYKFKFSRSKLNFRPGWEYYLKVDMMFANGQPATGKDIKANLFKNDVFDESAEQTTDSKGQAIFIFTTSKEADTISFTAATTDNRQESDRFDVEAYVGQNQIQVERIIKDKDMVMRASTNVQGSSYTGMLFMVVTRGKVVYTKFKESANQASEVVTEDLQEMISPSARLLVFYVDEGKNVLVADSVKFDVDQKCRGKGLKLETTKEQVKPGSNDMLSITGDSLMWVGLNVMDKALLLLNNKNVLRKNKMFEALESHDLGCGEGSGRSSADVFKKTGLTVLTNAVINEQELQRKSSDCQGNKRRRRDSDECFFGADESCCAYGIDYANEVVYEEDQLAGIDPYTKCYAKARDLILKKKFPMKCVLAYFYSCQYELEILITESTGIITKSFDDESDYVSDLARLAEDGVKPKIRSDFRESWLFEVDRLDDKGNKKKVLSYPDSITEWMIQAIGITPDKGMCIADPVDVKAFRDFFIQLDLPYKATRLEHFNVKATIFNYGLPMDDPKTANIYLEGVDNLCYNTESGKPSPKTIVTLKPNSAETVRFPMIPLKHGKFPITVSAIVTDSGISEVDVIRKPLYVVNEGIEEQMTIQICLDPNNQMKDCKNDDKVIGDVSDNNEQAGRVYTVDLTLPKKSIAGSGSATGYMQSNIMDNVVKTILEGVDSLFQQPAGCGEQTMIRLAPTVYAMMYLKEKKLITKDIEIRGNQFIRNGVTREVSQYRHPDGSYSAWQNRQSSTWLTAFVAKVFCQAKEVVDDAVDKEKDIVSTINWLKNHVTGGGEFIDHMPVIHREMIGQINERDPSLTAFVLVTLLECDIRTEDLAETIKKSTAFLENLDEDLLKNNPYLLAISTYALAMAESKKKWTFKDLLHETQTSKEDVYWGNAGGKPASAHAVESTAYALLAMLQFGDYDTSARIVRWLTSQRDASGSFRTTQDTVVGLQALSKYSIATASADVDLKVKLFANDWNGVEFEVTRENAVVQQIAKNLPVESGDNTLTVRVTGTGTGRMIIDLRYNRPAEEEEVCPFDVSYIEVDDVEDIQIDPNLAKESNCDICGRCEKDPPPPVDYPDAFDPPEADPKMESNFGRRKKRANRKVRATSTKKCITFSVSSKLDKEFGMSIVNFGLETGVEVVKDDLDKLVEDNPNIARYEMPTSGKGFVVFYLQKITSEETPFIFRLKDGFEGNIKTRQPSSVKVYDYYNPDQSCTQFYGTGPNQGQSIDYECDKSNQQCQCLQKMCIQTTEEEIGKKSKPALWLYQYSCNPEKANYAVLVTIESVEYDPDTEQITARGIVKDSIHQGIEQLDKDDEMAFFWTTSCDEPALEEGSSYYIIGRDGNKFRVDDGDQEYRYPLMGTAVVIKERDESKLRRKSKMFIALQRYKKLMKGRKCQR